MATNSGKKARRAGKQGSTQDVRNVSFFKEVRPMNEVQADYLNAIRESEVVFGIGSAGTGKTFIAASYAAAELFYRRVRKIILTRPNVETGVSLGALPGELEEKYAPYLDPFDKVFSETLGRGFYQDCLKNKTIEPRPIGFMRGSSFDDAIILVDEAQNLTKQQLKMLLSRIGKNCKVILSGDPDQVDIHNSGLNDAVNRLENLPGIEVIEFEEEDIVRSNMCKRIIMAYRN